MTIGNGPLIVAAIHNGNYIREELRPFLALTDQERLYEEDPFTGFFADIAETSIIGLHSRFEIDLNRTKNKAIYFEPEQAWGLTVWEKIPPQKLLRQSYRYYDDFYRQTEALINNKIMKYGFAIIYDIHSYNHKRNGEIAPASANPDINIGTNGLRKIWEPVVGQFIEHLQTCELNGKPLDVRKNIRFKGGHFTAWINKNFDNKACSLAIEVKKIFMDEHTNELDPLALSTLKRSIEGTAPKLIKMATALFGAKITGY